MAETIRVLLAKNRMSVSSLMRGSGLSREMLNTILDGNYDRANVSSLKKIAAAIPNVRLVVRFEETTT